VTLLAADIGGTHARIGVFTDAAAPAAVDVRDYPTAAVASFAELYARFASDHGAPLVIRAAGVGIAGPVQGGRGALTNGAWGVSTAEIAEATGAGRATVINDLAALGWCVTALDAPSRVTLQAGDVDGAAGTQGVTAVMAPGTGLGEATVVTVEGRTHVLASESGHADFAARTDREWELAARLRHVHGRACIEEVLSGRGLGTIARLTHAGRSCSATTPEAVTANGLAAACDACAEALAIFTGALGAEAGNLALRTLPAGGVYIGGGMTGALLPLLRTGPFLDAFNQKAPMSDLLRRIAVYVVTDTAAGLRGAAIAARHHF
jgi:glucokinase